MYRYYWGRLKKRLSIDSHGGDGEIFIVLLPLLFDEWDCCANNVRVDSSHGHDFEISQFA